jgi:hypothetical protein
MGRFAGAVLLWHEAEEGTDLAGLLEAFVCIQRRDKRRSGHRSHARERLEAPGVYVCACVLRDHVVCVRDLHIQGPEHIEERRDLFLEGGWKRDL